MWQDQTIKIETEGDLEVAPDGFHVTWAEHGVTFTLIVPKDEWRRLTAQADEKLKEPVSA